MPLVSVIIPIYNAGDFLIPCFDSIASQKLVDIEVICILDCPSDGSDVLVKEYSKKDPRFRIIENTSNQHIGKSRNIGINAATGEWIAFCDHDDKMNSECLYNLFQATFRTNSPIVGSLDSYYHDFCPSDVSNINIIDAYKDLLSFRETINSPSIWTHLYKKSFIQENHIFFVDTKKVSIEDRLFNCSVFASIITSNSGVRSYPVVCKHLYNHGIEHTNSNISYRMFSMVVPTLEKLLEIMSQTAEINTTDLFYEAAGKLLYSSFKKEWKVFGLLKAIKHTQIVKEERSIYLKLLSKKSFFCKGLTIPKMLFLCLIKL